MRRKILYFLMFFPLIINIIMMRFLPDVIPVHFGENDMVNRWGSKYEIFILSGLSIVFGMIMLGISKVFSKTASGEEGKSGDIAMLGAVMGVIVLDIINFMWLYAGMNQITDLSKIII